MARHLPEHTGILIGKSAFFILLASLLTLSLPSMGTPEEPTQEPQGDQIPTSITSNRMEIDHKTNIVVFMGEVVAVKGELTVMSDRMEVYNDEETGNIERMIATGNVQIEKGKRHAKSERAVFDESQQTVVLTGNPEVWDEKDRIKGDQMTMYLEEDKSVVIGDQEKRVHALFYPKTQPKDGEVSPTEKGSGAKPGAVVDDKNDMTKKGNDSE